MSQTNAIETLEIGGTTVRLVDETDPWGGQFVLEFMCCNGRVHLGTLAFDRWADLEAILNAGREVLAEWDERAGG